MPLTVSNELRKLMLLEDIKDKHPKYEVFVTLASAKFSKKSIEEIDGDVLEFRGIYSFLIPLNQKKMAQGKFSYENFHGSGDTYFEDDGAYITGEIFEKDGVDFEIITNERHFEGLTIFYYEPTDRLVKYLKLHREENNWINPYTKDQIIKIDNIKKNEDDTPNNSLSIRKSELLDYLAARKCGLLVLRFVRRTLKTTIELVGLPQPFIDAKSRYGSHNWSIVKDSGSKKDYLYQSKLWESFWIDPAPKPRRTDASSIDDEIKSVEFQLENGEWATYNQDGKDRYLEIISFKLSMIESIPKSQLNRIKMKSISTLTIDFSDGSYLNGCINEEGQFQTLFVDISNLDIDKQRQLSGFSEPRKAKISREYNRNIFAGQFCETRPFRWTLCTCLEEINKAWRNRFNETLLLSPNEENFPDRLLIGPTSKDYYELVDIMLEFQKLIIPEYSINEIKEALNLRPMVSNDKEYEELRAIGFIKLFFKANREDKKEGESYVLALINKLRNCKGHPMDINKVLTKFNIKEDNPRKTFLIILSGVCIFLKAFRELTEKAFGENIDSKAGRTKIENPWTQLEMAGEYF
ncbi:MAG: hypothetical protein GTO45_13215, partial [Candidatus Aminicenantes bacterium]|nr:hypothetical protein [Candidatus Aminicenantes bacterium]NIM79734.1 hypothetical protein [Candidatus Aminicenantes bacterium]NIN19065.1 hypothetical protein [Candidatus Aminicenantes bacterium]NIN42967.1 hypothetical protein [Candidatus Aminicenantes bacterium]NIN85710.1 hypothetical protein [Candidatus Aminicenantes bacterium]